MCRERLCWRDSSSSWRAPSPSHPQGQPGTGAGPPPVQQQWILNASELRQVQNYFTVWGCIVPEMQAKQKAMPRAVQKSWMSCSVLCTTHTFSTPVQRVCYIGTIVVTAIPLYWHWQHRSIASNSKYYFFNFSETINIRVVLSFLCLTLR